MNEIKNRIIYLGIIKLDKFDEILFEILSQEFNLFFYRII
jgi:hypothetical protein